MKTKKHKSSRQTLRVKYVIEKKAKAHKRRMKKQARKNPLLRRAPKPVALPEDFYTPEMIESARAALEFEKTKRLERRQQRRAEIDASVALADSTKDLPASQPIDSVIHHCDLVLHLLDARDPEGTRSLFVESCAVDHRPCREIIYVLNKTDLVKSPEIMAEWVAFYEAHQREVFPMRAKSLLDVERLLKVLQKRTLVNGHKRSILVGIVGLPSVGKTTLLSSLRRKARASAGKGKQIVDGEILSLDSCLRVNLVPGVVVDVCDEISDRNSHLDLAFTNRNRIYAIPPQIPEHITDSTLLQRHLTPFEIIERAQSKGSADIERDGDDLSEQPYSFGIDFQSTSSL